MNFTNLIVTVYDPTISTYFSNNVLAHHMDFNITDTFNIGGYDSYRAACGNIQHMTLINGICSALATPYYTGISPTLRNFPRLYFVSFDSKFNSFSYLEK
jgi:hypothetical protein